MVHGDDFVTTGREDSLKWFKEILSKKLEIKTEVIGPDKEDKKRIAKLSKHNAFRHVKRVSSFFRVLQIPRTRPGGGSIPDRSETWSSGEGPRVRQGHGGVGKDL